MSGHVTTELLSGGLPPHLHGTGDVAVRYWLDRVTPPKPYRSVYYFKLAALRRQQLPMQSHYRAMRRLRV